MTAAMDPADLLTVVPLRTEQWRLLATRYSLRSVTDTGDPNDLVQMNTRVPRWVRDRIDARRAGLRDPATGRPLSRDKWVANAAVYALQAPTRTPTNNATRRTAPPARKEG